MTLMLDPTLAAEAETQSLHAWSQEDTATELVEYRQRSWRLPAAAAFASVAVVAGVFLAWPQSAGKPQVAPENPQAATPSQPAIPPALPAQQQNPDRRFISLLQQRGVKVVSPPAALKGAHDVCSLEDAGHNAKEIAQAFTDVTPGANFNTEGVFVMTAEEIYCPK